MNDQSRPSQSAVMTTARMHCLSLNRGMSYYTEAVDELQSGIARYIFPPGAALYVSPAHASYGHRRLLNKSGNGLID